jgi:hypothetical protein
MRNAINDRVGELGRLSLWLSSLLITSICPAATFTVANTNDSGTGSLRQAITDSNSSPGPNVIAFSIPGNGVQSITPLTPLPDITNTVSINGYSQPGSQPNSMAGGNNAVLLVRLDGVNLSAFPNGLRFNGANNCSVRGLIIVRFYTGIQLYASSGCTIAGNWLGLDFDSVSRGGSGTGIDVTCAVFNRSTANLLGGSTPADRNVVAGFHTGISFFPASADHNAVQGNFIGTDATGTLPRGQVFEGIHVQAATNITIGGFSAGVRNLISANGTGISLLGSTGDLIQGNYIGTDVSGRYALGNSGDGIDAQGCSLVTIGGNGAGNLVVNNMGYGISFLGANTNYIYGNWIGTSGTWAMGNGKEGIYLQGSSANTIGGPATNAANVIEFNGAAGVNIYSGNSNNISANSIYDNAGPGIQLGSGANQSQTAPLLFYATNIYGIIQAQGTLASQPGATFRLEFFASPAWDPTATNEGRVYLGATNVLTDPSGNADFIASAPASTSSLDTVLTATATDAVGNTSQFSQGIQIVTGPQNVSLSISIITNTALISWPSSTDAGFQLQSALSLTSPVQWLPVTNAVKDNGVNKWVMVTNYSAIPRTFFRLKK